MRSTGSIPRILTVSLLLTAARAAADGPYVSVSASGTWQSNVTDAPSGDGILGAFTLGTSADLTWIHSVDFSTMLSYGVASSVDVCTTFDGLDSLSAGPRLTLRHKLGVGPYAPFVSVGLEGDAVGFNDPERSKLGGAVVAGYGQRFNDSIQLLVDARLGGYDARDIVFCGNYAGMNAVLNWDVDETWRFKLMAGWRTGDVVSNYTAIKTSDGWVPIDPGGFANPGAWHYVATFHRPFVAWRVSARSWSSGIGVSPAVGAHSSLLLQFVSYVTYGYDRYVNNVVSASIVHHF